MPIVVDAPSFDFRLGVFQRHELRDVQALIAQPLIEQFYVPVFGRFSRLDESVDPARVRADECGAIHLTLPVSTH